MNPDCRGCFNEATYQLSQAQQPPPHANFSGLFLVGSIVLVFALDFFLLHKAWKWATESQSTQYFSKKWWWFGAGIFVGFNVLAWHMVFGF